jgi:AcrR family transcriptional regulator
MRCLPPEPDCDGTVRLAVVRSTDASGIVRRPPFGTNPLVGERGTDTQRRILDAALEVFGEVGFNEAKVELITERAGCSRPAFYQYFSSKDAVFRQLAGRLGHEMVELADGLPRVGPDAGGVATLTAWVEDFVRLYEAHAPVFVAFQAASRDHDQLVRSSHGISDRTGDALLRAFGLRRSARSGALAEALVAVLIRCSFYARALAGGVGRPQLVASLGLVVHRVLAGPTVGVNLPATDGRRGPTAASSSGGADRAGDVASGPSGVGDGRRRPRGERTRRRLLDAGAVVLPARGYHDARVDDIVDAAGVSHGTFYRYFDNKDHFFRVLAEAASGELVELLDALPPATDDGALRGWLDRWFDAYEGNGGIIGTWQEMRADEEIAAFSQRVAAAVLDRLGSALAGRAFGDPAVDALVLLAVLERIPYGVYTLRFSTRAEATEAMVAILRRGLYGLPDRA